MIKLLILALCLFQGFSGLAAQNQGRRVTLPSATGFVNDYAGVMTVQDRQAIERLATTIKARTGAELAIVTIDSYTSMGNFASIEDFSLALAQSWGIGGRGEDTGVLLVLSMTERRVRIEVGYGLEGAIPDSVAGRIIDTLIIPAFREGDFSRGLFRGFESIAALVARENGLDLAELNLSATATPAQDLLPLEYIPYLIPIIWIFFVIPLLTISRRRRLRRGPVITSFGTGTRVFGSSRHYTGGGFGGGFGGGGFGGFGGGGFGGGGASRGF